MGGGAERGAELPPGVPRDPDPPEPPGEVPPFCARIGKADNAIARAQTNTGLNEAIAGWDRTATIRQMLYLILREF